MPPYLDGRMGREPKLRPLLMWLLLALMTWGYARAPQSFVVTSTAYTSSVRETDSTPHITATGARTRVGIIALSRDLLGNLPYGSQVKLEDLGNIQGRGVGAFNKFFAGVVFVVEDTMNPRMRQKMDVWMPDRRMALQFGVRKLKVTVLRVGR